MKADDVFDAPLTELGVKQADEAGGDREVMEKIKGVELICASPLSRAIDTAGHVFKAAAAGTPRYILEDLREINGWMVNGKRRRRSQLADLYSADGWDLSNIATDEDVLFNPEELEGDKSVRDRANEVKNVYFILGVSLFDL